MPAEVPFVVQKFPKFEAFDLSGDTANGSFLAQLIRENPNHIVCLLLAPSTDEIDQQPPMIIGSCSANRLHEIVEHSPHLETKYSHAVLCIWKTSISSVHAFVARNLRYCFTPKYGDEEGSKALHTLEQVAPFTTIFVTTPSEIFDDEFSQINGDILDLVRTILILRNDTQKGKDSPFSEGW